MSKHHLFYVKNILIWGLLFVLFSFVIFGVFVRYKKDILNSHNSEQISQPDQNLNKIENTSSEDSTKTEPDKPSLNVLPPIMDVQAYTVMDLKSEEILYSQNPHTQLPPASLTKVMTAVVALEEYNLSKSVVVPEKCVGLNGARIGLKANEVFTLEDLLYGLLVQSGADAACAIANITSERDFLEDMNKKAKDIGLEETIFQNEIGFDAENNQLTSVEDIRKLSLYALKISTFRKIVGTKYTTIKSLTTGQSYYIQNTNDLLFTIPGTVGIKTGTTDKAGQCLSYLYQNKDREILIIILGSKDRFKDTTTLLNWANAELDYRAEEL